MLDVEKTIKIARLLLTQNRFQQLGLTLIGIGVLGLTAVELTDLADSSLMNNDDAYTNFESWIDYTCWTITAGGTLAGIGLVAPVYQFINLLHTISSDAEWRYSETLLDEPTEDNANKEEGSPGHASLTASCCKSLSEWISHTATQWVGADPDANDSLRPLLGETQQDLFTSYTNDAIQRSY